MYDFLESTLSAKAWKFELKLILIKNDYALVRWDVVAMQLN